MKQKCYRMHSLVIECIAVVDGFDDAIIKIYREEKGMLEQTSDEHV